MQVAAAQKRAADWQAAFEAGRWLRSPQVKAVADEAAAAGLDSSRIVEESLREYQPDKILSVGNYVIWRLREAIRKATQPPV